MLFDPAAYFAYANMSPDHFPPSVDFWGWFGISGGVFYGGYLLIYRRAPFMALGCAFASLGGVVITAYMLIWGPLSGRMAAIHLSGDLAGLIGFGIAAWLEYVARREGGKARHYFDVDEPLPDAEERFRLYGQVGQSFSGNQFAEPGLEKALAEARTQKGTDLVALSQEKEVMLVFLRHFGCTFCREALGDLRRDRSKLEAAGKEIVLVHMVDEETAGRHIAKYGLEDLHRISDPEKRLYDAFALGRASFRQAFGLRNWVEGFRAGILKGHFLGKQTGDGWQMPGVFVLRKGEVVRGFTHRIAADRPDYCRLGECGA